MESILRQLLRSSVEAHLSEAVRLGARARGRLRVEAHLSEAVRLGEGEGQGQVEG